MFEYDLHVHTTASDGILTPAEVIMLACQCGLRGIAITDHDTVNGVIDPNLFKLARKNEIEVIAGIEINTDYEDEEVHILGYFIDVREPQLLKRLEEIKQARVERMVKIVDRLHHMGIDISLRSVYKIAGTGAVGRPHIAMVMIENGYAATIKEVFDKYLRRGGLAYVPRYRLLLDEAMTLIKNAGGVAILAHPGLIKNKMVIEKVMNMGVEGMEVFYPEHTNAETSQFLNMARQRKLLVTGGSDFHGTENRNQLGCTGLDHLLFHQFVDNTGHS